MTALFGSVVTDVLIAAVCGLVGGFGLGLLAENGIELPRRRSKIESDASVTAYFDFGFLADVVIGAMAAVIVYALNPAATSVQLIGSSIVAGLGGAGILKGFVETRRNQLLGQVANTALDLADSRRPGDPGRTRGLDLEGPGEATTGRDAQIERLRRQVDELT
ncbi:MAG TPA: DUF4257 domain-containing protein [Aggregatilineales bacterium]|nr:DUF4257 domain-containing protein [Aggregatilineales bacterium]